ncbi:MAG: hypothetical protein ACXIUB_01290 [Wenzhouxiangella sp.]
MSKSLSIWTPRALMLSAVALMMLATSFPAISAVPWRAGTSEQTERRLTGYQQRYLEAIGLEPLSEVELPLGHEEIRLWLVGNMKPKLVRVTQTNGHISGEVFIHLGDVNRKHGTGLNLAEGETIKQAYAERCRDFHTVGNATSCRGHFPRQPDWPLFYQQLRLDQLWELPDQYIAREHDNTVTIGRFESLAVELRQGTRYRVYSYDNVSYPINYPNDRQATIIAGRIHRVLQQLPARD